MEALAETWRWVPGFEDLYRVSDQGNVFSVRAGRNLRPGKMSGGHVSVSLGRRNSRCVHALVLEAFVGPRPAGAVSRHLNGTPSDNRLCNLEWSTYTQNARDKKHHTHRPSGYRLTVSQVLEIRRMLAEGTRRKDIAAAFDVALSTVYAIRSRRFHVDV